MSALKNLVLILLYVETINSYPASIQSFQPYNLQPYGYPYPQSLQGSVNIENSPKQSIYPVYPFYPQYGDFYQPYQNLPFLPNFQPYPDPFANFPVEIIDVDESLGQELSWEDVLRRLEIASSQHTAAVNPANPIISTQVVTTKPAQATITRTFTSDSADPLVNVQYSGFSSNVGSGTLIRAGEEEGGNEAAEKDDERLGEKAEIEAEDKDDGEDKEEEDSFFRWG